MRFNIILFVATFFTGSLFAQVEFEFDDVKKLSSQVNTKYEETQPVFDPNNNLLYFTRSLNPNNTGGIASGQDIWSSSFGSGAWSESENVSELNNLLNNAVLGVSANGDTLFLLSTYQKKQSLQKGFSISYSQGENWSKPEEIDISGLNIKSDYYSGYMDKTGTILILSLEGKHSTGQEDLYVSTKSQSGWSKPLWLGETINSSGYEFSPFLFSDQRTLFFASNGHGGFGDCDIFYSYRKDSTWTNWTKPKNLGNQINSPGFDAYPYFSDGRLYFASSKNDSVSNIYSALTSDELRVADTMRLSFRMNNSSLPNVNVGVFDEQGNAVGDYGADDDNNINIPNLKEGNDYTFKPRHESVDLSLFTPFVLNEDGEPIGVAPIDETGSMTVTAVSKEENDVAEVIEEPEYIKGMSGVFELDNVPVPNVILALTDEDGFPTQYAVTDENGAFEFADTDGSVNLVIEVISDLEYVKQNGEVFYTGEDGTKLLKAVENDGSKGLFSYQRLEAQELAQLQMLKEQGSNGLEESSGVFEFNDLPREGVRLNLLDANDNIIETVTTDENGEFRFTKLQADRGFQIKLSDEEDPTLRSEGLVYFMDANGNDLNILNSAGDGDFQYKPLRSELSSGLRMLEEDDASSLSDNYVFSVGLFEYQNQPQNGVILSLLDANGQAIETVSTNDKGQFVFSMLRPGIDYKIEVVGSNPTELLESEMYFISRNGEVVTASNEKGTINYLFENLSTEFYFDIRQLSSGIPAAKIEESFKDISGQFSYEGLPKENVKLYLLDEYNKVIDTVYTDVDGNFVFQKLARESSFFVKLAENDAGLLEGGSFLMKNEQNQEIEQSAATDAGFSFKTLPRTAMSMSGLEEEDGSFLIGIKQQTSGLFKFNGIRKPGSSLQLLDDNQSDVETVTTDDNGQFFFSKMQAGKSYSVRAKDFEPSEMEKTQLYFIGKSGEVTSTYIKTGTNIFTFDPLVDDYYSELGQLDVEDSEFDLSRSFSDILGQASVDGKPAGGQRLKAMDEKGVVTHEVTAADDGTFELSAMPNGTDFTVEIVSTNGVNPAEVSLNLKNEDGDDLGFETLENGQLAFSTPDPIPSPTNGVKQQTSGLFKHYGMRKPASVMQLLNQNQSVVETVTTDDNGQFFFTKMQAGKSYSVRAKDFEPSEMEKTQLYFIGKSGEVSSTNVKEGTNIFTFDPLVDDYFSELGQLDVEDSEFDLSRSFSDILGQASVDGKPAGGQRLKAMDEKGVVTHEVTAADDGTFELSAMPNGTDFTVEIVSTNGVDPAEVSLNLKNEDGDDLGFETLENGQLAFSTPDPIPLFTKTSESSNRSDNDDDGMAMLAALGVFGNDIALINETHFDKDRTVLKQEEKFELYYAYKELTESTGPILIVGFSCDSSDPVQRKKVAKSRASVVREYFIKIGIEQSRIQTVNISNGLENVTSPSKDQFMANRKTQVFLQAP